MDDRWPRQDFLELGALLSAVPCARLHARQVLWEWGIAHLGDSAGLLVTELVANAVRASREMTPVPAVRLWLLSDSAQILILVWDASPQPPVLTGVADEAEHGRGLRLVEAVSEQWGWYPREDGDGKFVWAIARLCLPGESHPAAIRTGTAWLSAECSSTWICHRTGTISSTQRAWRDITATFREYQALRDHSTRNSGC
jgi:anti-sigma regulatory factor (Ser/Thr protein kinase)